MTTKLENVLIYHEEIPPVKLHDLSIARFCEVTWHIKYFINPLVMDQWLLNMAR